VAAISLQQLTKRYPNGHLAVRESTLEIGDGEFAVLVGPSGCGKSTLLRLIAGLEQPTTGRVLLGDRDVTDVPPQDRDVAMVFQSYALYPHMSVRDNLAYGLKVRGLARAEISSRIERTAAALELGSVLDRRPSQLSGGQRQRVALGRAMVREPRAFLFDEPLSNLDPALRAQSRTELLRLHQRLETTVIYVTHDQEEAMTLADRVAVMRAGTIEQVDAPLQTYARPVNTFVAQFIGSPPMNLLPYPIPGVPTPVCSTIGIRPHDVVIGDSASLDAVVDLVEPRGHDAVLHLTLSSAATGARLPIVAVVPMGMVPARGSRVGVTLRPDALHCFDREGRRVAAAGE
jgi:ABC-type sugar transport system ATPase subunit